MTSKRYTPIIIGVGDIKNASIKSEDAIEPMQLMVQAAGLALKDTALNPLSVQKLRSSIDSVSTVASWTWNYHDLPGLVGEKLGVKPKYRLLSHHGGDSPAKLLDEAARRISFGESKVAVVTGGEALASRT
jgi:acetyl-CoA acetyltransferase